MPAIRYSKTETSDRAWDGPANEANLRTGESESYYRKAYAWQDPEGDPTTKDAYRFIHHFVSNDGTVGPASTRGCSAGIGVCNGGRGGTTIPRADIQGVYNHLAAHLKDAGMEPPELMMRDAAPELERRYYRAELRAQEINGQTKIIGYGAVFNSLSENLGGFQEIVQPGAFGETLGDDIRSLFNHDFNLILGRTAAKTLVLSEDDLGLRYEITPPDTSYANDLVASIKRGDVDQSSFGFRVVEESWVYPNPPLQPLPVRKLLRVKLYDVGPVTFAAYPQTSVAVRDHLRALEQKHEKPPKIDYSTKWLKINFMQRNLP